MIFLKPSLGFHQHTLNEELHFSHDKIQLQFL